MKNTNTGLAIISDPFLINAGIAEWGKDGAKHRVKGHLLLVSALVHVAIHGNVKVLNNLFKIAATNERTMIRNYVRRFQTEMELSEGKFMPKRDDDGNEVQTDVAFLDFAKQEFHVRGGHKYNRDRFVTFANDHLINPSKRWPMFSDINIRAEATRFDTMSLANRLKTLLKAAEKAGDQVAPKALKRLSESVDYITSVADDFADGATESAQEAADMAKLGAAFNADFDRMYNAIDGTKADPVDNSEPATMIPPANEEPKARTRRGSTAGTAQSGNA